MFSKREARIIEIVSKKTLTLGKIAEKLFKDEMPMDANILVANSVSRIIKKCKFYEFNWTLTKTKKDNKLVITKEGL